MASYTYMSLGGGVQSTTMAEMIVEGVLPKPNLVIFADTGDEPSYVYENISYLDKRLNSVGVELARVRRGNLVEDLASPQSAHAVIPVYSIHEGKRGRLKRKCTGNYKIMPIESEVKRRLFDLDLVWKDSIGRFSPYEGTSVDAWLGISFDEIRRMKKNKTEWITNTYPLIQKRMTRSDCIKWLLKRGLPVPRKSSCRICPFHSDENWAMIKEHSPEDWAYAVDFDRSLRDERKERFSFSDDGGIFLHRDLIPLEEVDLDFEDRSDEDLCDEGYCFI